MTTSEVSLAEQLAAWADRLRDLSALGLHFADDVYNHDRYASVQQVALELLALANGTTPEALEPLRATLFNRPSPLTAGAAAIIDPSGAVLLTRRHDNGLWNMPGGLFEVGETAAEAVVREVKEETGLMVEPIALVGVHDSRIWDVGSKSPFQFYKFTFLCRLDPAVSPEARPSHAHETLETAWFGEDELPEDLQHGHRMRIREAYRVWRGDPRASFDY